MQINIKGQRVLAFLLSLLILVSGLPLSSLAESDTAIPPDIDMYTSLEQDAPLSETVEVESNETGETTSLPEIIATEEPSVDLVEDDIQDSDSPDITDGSTSEEEPRPEVESLPEETPLPTELPPPEDTRSPLQQAIEGSSYAYVTTTGATKVYGTADMRVHEHFFTLTDAEAVLLATEYVEREEGDSIKVIFITEDDAPIYGYIPVDSLFEAILSEDEIDTLAEMLRWIEMPIGTRTLQVFMAKGISVSKDSEEPNEVVPADEVATPNSSDPFLEEEVIETDHDTEQPAVETPEEGITEDTNHQEEEQSVSSESIEVSEESTIAENITDDTTIQPENSSNPSENEVAAIEVPQVQVGDFVVVSKKTSAFLNVDNTASSSYEGDLCVGVFVNSASVEVEAIEQDSQERYWYRVKYMYGDDYKNGTLKWFDYGSIYVLATEVEHTDVRNFGITDYTFATVPSSQKTKGLRTASPMNGFTLKSINGSIGTFTLGDDAVHGSSGRDRDYPQIATIAGHGTVYATPHYLDGFTVYCLEHNLPGPGENISGGGQQPSGPYLIVDMDSYLNTPGNSKVIYKKATMHAIAWVLRHAYPFMVLDRSDANNETWSRVAGQFAIREVIKQMEGAQYVRDYWDLSVFYVASGQAPDVYLAYARWLAANGIARGKITGKITASNKSVSSSNGKYIGTVTLTTDADLIRIEKGKGTIAGHTAGEDDTYYYLHSGDTIAVTSNKNGFTLFAESISSDEEEAGFLVGVPSVGIQKVLIPQYRYPYKMKDISISFEEVIHYGGLIVTKLRDRGDESPLSGAQFQLYDSNSIPIGSPVSTDEKGEAKWTNLAYGTYYVAEAVPPEGYQLDSTRYTIEIGDALTLHTHKNAPIHGSIRIVKKAREKDIPLADAKYELVTKINGSYVRAKSIADGSEQPVLSTDGNGAAVWSNVEYGDYYVHEVEAPEGYQLDASYYPVSLKKQGVTETASVSNAIIKGKMRIVKKDALTKEALPGAIFSITRLSAPASHNGVGTDDVVATVTTDSYGIAETGWLDWGRYRIEETKVPEGYVDNGYSLEVAVGDENLKIYEIEVENEPAKGWIKLTKTDRQNGNPIPGIQFDIYYDDAYGVGLAATMVTDKDGIALSEPLRKGKYIVKEYGDTDGYLFEVIELDATVKPNKTTELYATNCHVTVKITLYKRDAEEYKGDNPNASAKAKPKNTLPKPANIAAPVVRGDGILMGAEFQVLAGEDIKDRQGNILHEKGSVVIPSLKTAGDDAYVTTDELWPGLYEIVELSPPVGYQPGSESIFVDARSAASQSQVAVVTYEGLVLNKVRYGAKAIVKILGNEDGNTDPSRIEEPEVSAEFRVYLKSAGSYENAKPFERDHLTTDKNGYAMTKALPYGIYVLEQTIGKDGYEIKGPITFEIDGTENLSNPPIMTLNDKPIRYRLRLIKTDSETGRSITQANTFFKVKDAQGQYITQKVYYPKEMTLDTFATDDTGSVTLPEAITWGLYTIEEVASPEGYLIAPEDTAVFVGRSEDKPGEVYALDVQIPNDPVKGRIILEKKGLQLTGFESTVDDYGNAYYQPVYEETHLEGASFEVYAAEDIIGRDNTTWYRQDELVDTIATTSTGSDASKLLPLGKYYLIESSTPNGYVSENIRYEANLCYADNKTEIVEVHIEATNQYLPGSISLHKEKEIIETIHNPDGTIRQVIGSTAGEGFVFGLYNESDIHYNGGFLNADTLIATGVTDEEGNLTFSGYYPHCDYYIKELSAPEGWKITSERFPVSLGYDRQSKDNEAIFTALEEPILNELIYTHITLTKKDITGENSLPGALIEVMNSRDEVIHRAYTDEHGQIPDIPLVPGDYTFREILAPEGYALSKETMHFSVNEHGDITGDTVMRNDYTRFSIRKHDENGLPMAGVEFHLLKEDGSLLLTSLSDEKGLATFEKVPYGRYSIEESRALPGYVRNKTSVQFRVDGSFANPTEPLTTLMNVPNEVMLRKVDQDGEALAGATFGLFSKEGEQIMTAHSDREGMVRFQRIPHGDYTIRETIPPEGYLQSMDIIHLTMNDSYSNSALPLATITNQRKHISLIKMDTAGNPMEGAAFSLINAATGETVETAVSDDKGTFAFTKFDYGDWMIRETKAPDGFNRMEDIMLHIDEDWEAATPIPCVNIPNHYTFIKVDNKGNPMVGVRFTLEDGDGRILRELVSGDDGIVDVTDLALGSYTIRETETLEGFTRTEETIRLVIDKTYIVPKETYRLVNYPDIQTGVEFVMMPIMWVGVVMMLSGITILIVYGIRNRQSRRRRK